ncbi:Bbp19 family protein [Azospirillum argentinense]
MSWEDLDKPKQRLTPEQEAEQRRLNGLFARVFGTADGLEVLALLRSSTIEKPISPDASHSALVHLEGQRQLVRVIETRVANGRDQHPSELRREYPALRRAAE